MTASRAQGQHRDRLFHGMPAIWDGSRYLVWDGQNFRILSFGSLPDESADLDLLTWDLRSLRKLTLTPSPKWLNAALVLTNRCSLGWNSVF